MRNEGLEARAGLIGAGERAPDFVLLDQSREEWRLSEACRGGDVVLCFYPMDFSPVCTTEMRCVAEELERFSGASEVVGISCDSFFVHEAWARELGLRHRLLADMHRSVCRAYGLYFADLNVAARGTVVVGGDGVVKWSQGRELGTAMDLDEVIAGIS